MDGCWVACAALAPKDSALQPFHAPLLFQVSALAKLALGAGLCLDMCSPWKGNMGSLAISPSLMRAVVECVSRQHVSVLPSQDGMHGRLRF
jgi:hypothetical protein